MDLTGRVAIVTGGGSGIGRAIAQDLVTHGASVLILGRTESALEKVVAGLDTPERGSALAGDVQDPAFTDRAVAMACEQFGHVDFLCNNAGQHEADVPHELSLETWNAVLGTNLTGAFLLTRSVIPHMIERGGGVIVNVGSIASSVANGGGVAYVASKHGLLGMTRQLAMYYGHSGIRVNCVCPGQVETDMVTNFMRANPDAAKASTAFSARLPAGRMGLPDEIAAVVRFLFSDEASYVTGAAWYVDGGYTLGHLRPEPATEGGADET